MATDAQQIADSGENEDLEKQGAEDQGAETQQQDDGDSPYADLAKEMGWVPKDQFQGDPEAWKPADQFIRDGRDIQRETSRELKAVRQQLDTIAKTSASIVEQKAQERAQELMREHQQAVDDGDPKKAFELAKEITTLTTEKPAQSGPGPEVQDWVQRNSSWFRQPGHELATARAIEITNLLQSQGITDHAQQLKIAEQRLRVEKLIPEASNQRNGKQPPGVNAPSGRTSGAGSRQKGFSDLPKEAQDIGRQLEERGVLKAEGNMSAREVYAKHYWKEAAAKAAQQ